MEPSVWRLTGLLVRLPTTSRYTMNLQEATSDQRKVRQT